MDKKFWISALVAIVVTFAVGFLGHGLILSGDYKPLMGGLMRTEEGAMGLFHFMIIAHIIMGIGAAWIYRQGVTDGPWPAQGVRFGIAAAAISSIPLFMIFYVVHPMPGMVTVKQLIVDTISWIIVGLALAFVNKK